MCTVAQRASRTQDQVHLPLDSFLSEPIPSSGSCRTRWGKGCVNTRNYHSKSPSLPLPAGQPGWGPRSVREGGGSRLPPWAVRGGGLEGEEAPGLRLADVPAEASAGAFNKT